MTAAGFVHSNCLNPEPPYQRGLLESKTVVVLIPQGSVVPSPALVRTALEQDCCCREASRCFPGSELEHIQLQSGFRNKTNGHLIMCSEDRCI